MSRILQPGDLTILIDAREKQAFEFPGMRTEISYLWTGDYSLKGLQNRVAIERKSVSDLASCCGQSRRRFERELGRLRAYELSTTVVECTWEGLAHGEWRSQVTPAAVQGSVLSCISRCHSFVFAGNREEAQRIVGEILWHYGRHEFARLRGFGAEINATTAKTRYVTNENAMEENS